MPDEEYLCDPNPRSVVCRPLPEREVPTWRVTFYQWTDEGERDGLTFHIILARRPNGTLEAVIEDLTFGVVDTVDEFDGRVPSSVVSARHIQRGLAGQDGEG